MIPGTALPFEPPVVVALAALTVAGAAAWATVTRRRRSADASRAYLKGFRYILSDEPDAALEELTRAVEVDARTAETYFALGALFRRTGDHERAIRLHQNMLLKADFDPKLKAQVQLELALDFHRGGMLESAAEAYRKVLETEPAHAEALLHLRQLHEELRNWALAGEAEAQRVQAGAGSPAVLAHLLAEAAASESDAALAAGFAEKAVEVCSDSAHAVLTLGLLRLGQRRPGEAAAAVKKAAELDPELAVRAAEPLFDAEGPAAAEYFQGRLAAGDHPATRAALARCLLKAGRIEQATEHLRRAIELDPRYVEARVSLARALLASSLGDSAKTELQSLLAGLGQLEPAFQCRQCGNGYAERQFLCGRCRSWDEIARVSGSPQGPTAAPEKANLPS